MLLLMLTATVGAAVPAVLRAAEGAGPAWPANAKVIDARVAKLVFPEGQQEFPLPQLRIYDRQGRRVLERLGFHAPTFNTFVTRALDGGNSPSPHLLANELALVLAPDGKPLATLPDADYTIVDYWAAWCAPCHAQDRELLKVLSARPKTRVNLLRVEADLSQKTAAEVQKMIDEGTAAAAAAKKKGKG